MKICQLAAVDFTVYHFLLPLMRALRDEGHEIVVVCSFGSLVASIEAEGFRVETIGIQRSYNAIAHYRSYCTLVDFFEREQFDVVHVHTPIAALIGRLAAARAGAARIVYTAHGFYFHERQNRIARTAFQLLEWIAGRYTDVLFTQSQEDAEAGRKYRLCAGGLITAIGNGVDPTVFRPATESELSERNRLREEFRATKDEVVILMVGRLVAEKGYIELLEAMKSVEAHLWIVGKLLDSDRSDDIEDAFTSILDDPNMRDRISFLGYRDDVAEVMRAADIFTLPSHREGMPRSIIEAMMTSLPVVATNVRGSREEVVDGETGYLVPVSDATQLSNALHDLVSDKELRRNMGRAGRLRAEALYDEADVIQRQIEIMGLAT